MDRLKNTYDMIRKNMIFEEKIYYKKDKKQLIGCLVKSKYADQSDLLQFYLYESKTSKEANAYFDLMDYKKAEKSSEQKKDAGWMPLRGQKILISFELIPKCEKQKEIFFCETEENRNIWLRKLNECIDKLKTIPNEEYRMDSHMEGDYDEAKDEENENIPMINHSDERVPPAVPPRNGLKRPKVESLPSQITTTTVQRLNYIVPQAKPLFENDIIYKGSFDNLHKILCQINKSGVYAVSNKIQPEFDCNLAIRVYESDSSPILSWNIYENKQTKEYYLCENSRSFSNIVELCSYYTSHDLPSRSKTITRLILPYKYYHH